MSRVQENIKIDLISTDYPDMQQIFQQGLSKKESDNIVRIEFRGIQFSHEKQSFN